MGAAPGNAKAATEVELADANFAVLVLLPERVHELHLGGKQRAYTYTLEGAASEGQGESGVLSNAAVGAGTSWNVTEVNP